MAYEGRKAKVALTLTDTATSPVVSSPVVSSPIVSSRKVSSEEGFKRAWVEQSDQVVSHTCINLLYYWRAIRANRLMPKWPEVDLLALGPVVSHVIVKDVESGTTNEGHSEHIYRNRYWGTGIVSTLGFDGTHKTLQDYDTDQRASEAMTNIYDLVVEYARPVRSVGYIEFIAGREYLGYEALFLPLAGQDDDDLCHVIAAYDFQYDPETEGLSPLIGLV